MPGLFAGHLRAFDRPARKTSMAGTNPATTESEIARVAHHEFWLSRFVGCGSPLPDGERRQGNQTGYQKFFALAYDAALGRSLIPAALKGHAMRFWIECTRFETGQAVHINISLVGSMWRDGERTVLAFVGGDAERIEVTETPEHLIALHLGIPAKA
jgi:hypothetical protein